ncbi:hypothetical protein QE381_001726 [Microbacterium sp. SORGH_AS 888]|nr:hypothetical protein [Microbacterium sp. SORGH_AS_0888]
MGVARHQRIVGPRDVPDPAFERPLALVLLQHPSETAAAIRGQDPGDVRVHRAGGGRPEERDRCADHVGAVVERGRIVAGVRERAKQVRGHSGAVATPHLAQHGGCGEHLGHVVDRADVDSRGVLAHGPSLAPRPPSCRWGPIAWRDGHRGRGREEAPVPDASSGARGGCPGDRGARVILHVHARRADPVEAARTAAGEPRGHRVGRDLDPARGRRHHAHRGTPGRHVRQAADRARAAGAAGGRVGDRGALPRHRRRRDRPGPSRAR